MNAPTRDIKDYLVAETSLVFGTTLFIGILPEQTGLTVSLFDTSGMSPDPNAIRNPTVQVMVRGIVGGYEAAYTQMETILTQLHALANTIINSTNYIQIWKLTEPNHVGNDEKGRPIFSCTLRISRT